MSRTRQSVQDRLQAVIAIDAPSVLYHLVGLENIALSNQGGGSLQHRLQVLEVGQGGVHCVLIFVPGRLRHTGSLSTNKANPLQVGLFTLLQDFDLFSQRQTAIPAVPNKKARQESLRLRRPP